MPQNDRTTPADDSTIPSRKRRLENVTHFTTEVASSDEAPQVAPWALQHHFDGEIDLIKELSGRFPQVPVMSLIHIREVGSKTPRAVAALSTQDGAAGVLVEIDLPSLAVQFTFTLSSMLALRFSPSKLTQSDRAQWISLMRRESSEAAFLWEQSRWESDYLVSAAQKNFSTFFAFSPRHVEAAARLTPDVTHKLLDWFDSYWK